MYKETINGTSVITFLDARRTNTKNLYHLKIQVTHKRKVKYYPTGINLSPQQWQSIHTSRSAQSVKMKSSIKLHFDKVLSGVQNVLKQGAFSFEMLEIRMGRASSGTVGAIFHAKIEELKYEMRIGSYSYYKDALRSIEKFAQRRLNYHINREKMSQLNFNS